MYDNKTHVCPDRIVNIYQPLELILADQKYLTRENREVAGAIVLVYDHHKRDLQNKSTDLQHEYHQMILSVQHIHLDHNNCLETIAVKGKAKKLQGLSDKLISLKGIHHGKLIMTTTG